MKCRVILRAVVFLAVILSISIPAIAYSGGTGTQINPYQIATSNDLVQLSSNTSDYDKHFIMTNDIDMGNTGTFTGAVIAQANIVDWNLEVVPFTGYFNGNGFIINNLSINGQGYCGLFGYIGPAGTVTGLGLANLNVTGTEDYVGGLCSWNEGTISGCYVADSGSINGVYYVGGLCGWNYGTIKGCYANISVNGQELVGGVCGANYYGHINSSYSQGTVTGDYYIGGMCAFNLNGNIANCYAGGSVTGNYYVGGLCGYNESGSISYSYASAGVTATEDFSGGLCGYQYGVSANISNCFWDNQTSGQTVGCVLDTIQPGATDNVLGLATAQMQTQTTFTDAGWDFIDETTNGDDDIWYIESDDYPQLLWKTYAISIAELFIGEGTYDWNYPLSTYYHDARTQSIYLASEIGGSCNIISLSLNVSAKPGQTMNNFTIRLRHTDLDSYSSPVKWESTNWTTVFQDNVTITETGWNEFVFTTPFAYNDSQNLMVDISFNNDQWTDDGTCLSRSTNKSRSLYYRTDSGYGDPLNWSGNSNPTPSTSSNIANIKLIVSQLQGERVVVPDVVGLTLSQAQTELENAQLQIGLVSYVISDTVVKGYVVSQSPATDTEVAPGTQVSIVVSRGNDLYSGGTGTEADPFIIADADDLFEMSTMTDDYSSYFKMTADIDLANSGTLSEALIASGEVNNDNGEFNGTEFTGYFNGNGHVIRNLSIDGQYFCALFGCIGSDGIVINLGLENLNINGDFYTGGLAGWNKGKIFRSYASGNVTGSYYIGGLCGINYFGNMTSNYSKCTVNGQGYTGGLCGMNVGTLSKSYSCGDVNATGEGEYVAGLCGCLAISTGIINNCIWDTQASGHTTGYVLYSSEPGTATNVVGKTTAQMKTRITFTNAGWDFDGETTNGTNDIWGMPSGNYPRFCWQKLAGDIAGSWGVDISDLETLADNWLGSGIGDIHADGTVNLLDFAIVANNWLIMD